MKNVLNEKPSLKVEGRLKYTLDSFIDIDDISEKTVLDIGCGYGWFEMYALKKNVKEIYGTEITDTDLETARKYIKDKRVLFELGSAIDIPYKDNTFDTVVSWEVLEHIPKDTELDMFSEIHRVLKPGGKLYISTPHAALFSKIFDPGWWLIGHRHYSKSKMSRMLKSSKLKIIEMEPRGGWWSILATLHMYFEKWILRGSTGYAKKLSYKSTKSYNSKNGFVTLFVKATKK